MASNVSRPSSSRTLCGNWKVYAHGSRTSSTEPFHVSAGIGFARNPFDAARSYAREEDLLTELIGKELIARAIHNLSSRCGRPFIKLNCAAIPFDLLESELFGHEKGAFTGAIAQKIGRFELADKGTLFLDEVGDIPLALQPKLLRVLQEQEFERLGSGRTHRVDVRLVAATHRNLVEMAKRNEFRSALYYRLNVFPIPLPPLRARRGDIPALVAHFVEIYARKMNKPIEHITPETMTAHLKQRRSSRRFQPHRLLS